MNIPGLVSSTLGAALVVAVALLAIYGVHRARSAGSDRPTEEGDEAAGGSWFFVRYAPEPRDRDDRGI